MSMPQDQLLPAIHERVVFALSHKRLEVSQREALLLSLTNTLRRAGLRQTDKLLDSTLVTEDRFTTRLNSRRQVIEAMVSASGLASDVVSATLLLVEARVDVAIDVAGFIDIKGIGKFSRCQSKDRLESSERVSQWCQCAFAGASDSLHQPKFLLDLVIGKSVRVLRQLVVQLEIAEACRPPYPYEVVLSPLTSSGDVSQSEEGGWE